MTDIPLVLSRAQVDALTQCTPENPPAVGDYIVRSEGDYFDEASPRARRMLLRGHVCKVIAVFPHIDEVSVEVLHPDCEAAGGGWVLSYFSHYAIREDEPI